LKQEGKKGSVELRAKSKKAEVAAKRKRLKQKRPKREGISRRKK
jgi:hypothetical protein